MNDLFSKAVFIIDLIQGCIIPVYRFYHIRGILERCLIGDTPLNNCSGKR